MSDKHVPLIPSNVAGPLGILHLPRLWLKCSLEETGQLHADYPGIGAGYDAMLLDALKIEHDKFRSFIKENKPSYVATEKWVCENGTMCTCAIAGFNRTVEQYHHTDETRKGILDMVGLEDDGTYPDAPMLNNLDDWHTVHQEILKG